MSSKIFDPLEEISDSKVSQTQRAGNVCADHQIAFESGSYFVISYKEGGVVYSGFGGRDSDHMALSSIYTAALLLWGWAAAAVEETIQFLHF